jgi:hypothetical protein
MAQKSKKVPAKKGLDKDSILSRTGRADVIETNGPKSEIWKGNTVLQDVGQKLIAAGTALKTSQTAVSSIETQLEQARGVRATRVVEYDKAYDLFVSSAEAVAKTPEDLASVGLAARVKGTYLLAAPLGIDAKFDMKAHLIRAHIQRAPGMQNCLLEISTNPEDPNGWRRLPGLGAVRALSGYSPGTYWLRAASARANEQSEFTTPVSVIVK